MARKIIQMLHFVWRLLATGYCFFFFVVGGLLMSLTLLPLVQIAARTKKSRIRHSRQVVLFIWRFFVWQMCFLGLISVSVENVERLKHTQGKLVIANHPSLIDVILLYALMPNTCCVVKAELWRHPMIGGVIRAMGCIQNASAEDLFADCQEEARAGASILLFPEGTRTEANKPLEFQRGAANIAIRCDMDVVPVFIFCDPPTLRKGEPWYRIPKRRAEFRLYVQEDIIVWDVQGMGEAGLEHSQAKSTRQLNRYFETYFLEGLKKHARY